MIGHRSWRDYEAARVVVNDAMVTLLVATRLGALHVDEADLAPRTTLPEAFPQIQGIGLLHVFGDRAQWLMKNAEQHLAMMAIPYLLGVQESYLLNCLELLRRFGKDDPGEETDPPYVVDSNTIGLAALHPYLASRCGVELDRDELFLFEFLVRLRNRIAHHGGEARTIAADYAKGLKNSNQRKVVPAWEALSGRPLQVEESGILLLGEPEMIAALTLCRNLAVGVNRALGEALGEEDWIAIVIEETAALDPTKMQPAERRDRRLLNVARRDYSEIGIDPTALLEEAATRYPG